MTHSAAALISWISITFAFAGCTSQREALDVDAGRHLPTVVGSADSGADAESAPEPGSDAAVQPKAAQPTPRVERGSCDLVLQTGCASGEKCDLVNDRAGCVAAGKLAELYRCKPGRADECLAGLTCVETQFGDHRCARFCDPARAEPCGAETTAGCAARATSAGFAYHVCRLRHACIPTLQDCADASQLCYWSSFGAFCLTPQSNTKPDGAACQVPQECGRGSTCWFAERPEESRCFKICSPSATEPGCAAAQPCSEVDRAGADRIGLCGLD